MINIEQNDELFENTENGLVGGDIGGLNYLVVLLLKHILASTGNHSENDQIRGILRRKRDIPKFHYEKQRPVPNMAKRAG